MYSHAFSRYYDRLMGDYSSIIDLTKTFVRLRVPRSGSILELGCGTGTILQALASLKNDYQLAGLDISKGMVEVAKKKVPQASFQVGDMITFSSPIQYDCILCIFDSINHVPTFPQWNQVFSRVRKSLKRGGYFIFDMNTEKRLSTLATFPSYVKKIDKETLIRMNVEKKKHRYTAQFQIFGDLTSENVTYLEESVNEVTFPLERVETALKKHFEIEKKVDPIRKRITSKTGRVFFICKAK